MHPIEPTSSPSTRPGSATRRPLLARGAALVAMLVVAAGCGRSAPNDALDGLDGDPDIAGVSVTSPDAVVDTVATTPGETLPPSTEAVPVAQVTYVVQPGDTLSVIASNYDVSIEALAEANGIVDVNAIAPGEELVIPPAAQPIQPAVEGQPAEGGQPTTTDTAPPAEETPITPAS